MSVPFELHDCTVAFCGSGCAGASALLLALLCLRTWPSPRQAKEKEALAKSEALAEEGDVDGSMVQANVAEGFQKQYEALHTSFTQPERTMTVCDVCGVFINSTDNEQRRRVRCF